MSNTKLPHIQQFNIQSMNNDIQFKTTKPENKLQAFVESFWMLGNFSKADKEIVVLPDGRVDVFFMHTPGTKPFHTILMGLEVVPKTMILKAETLIFAVSFKLLAVEYLLGNSISDVLMIPIINANTIFLFMLILPLLPEILHRLILFVLQERQIGYFQMQSIIHQPLLWAECR